MSKVFNMVGGGGGPAASIFVTGLSETDTVTATKGTKTLNSKWTNGQNPAYHGLPSGYKELESIKSTGTQYIKTGLTPNVLGYEATVKFKPTAIPTNESWVFNSFQSDYNLWRCGLQKSSFRTADGFSYSQTSNPLAVTTGYGSNTVTSNVEIYLFAQYENGQIKHLDQSKHILYSCSISKNGVLLRDFIPCKRNSDGSIGLYDLVTNAFFGNSGTGTFVAGSEVPQTIYGHMISKIRDFGTWTVTATNGTKTATQNVLVDVITEYGIEMSLTT